MKVDCNFRRVLHLLYCSHMWPFRRKPPQQSGKGRRIVKRLIVGFIIGGAISSIVGKKLLHEKRREQLGEDAGE